MQEVLDAPAAERLDTLLESWRAGAPLTEWLGPLLDADELRALLTSDDFAWMYLRTRPQRDAAEALMRLRLQSFLRDDRLGDAEASVLDPQFVHDSLDRRYLAHIAGEVKCAVAWRRPLGAGVIENTFPDEQAPSSYGWDLHDHYHSATLLSGVWQRALGTFSLLEPLRRYYELWPLLDEAAMAETAGELLEDFHARPLQYRTALTSMHDAHPALLQRYVNSIQYLVGTDEERLSPRRRRSLQRAMKHADDEIREDKLYQNISAIVGFAILASLASFFWVGWWGIAIVLATAGLGFWGMHGMQKRLYRKAIQEPLMRMAVEEGLSVPALVQWIESNKKQVGELANFTPFLEEDPVLAAMHWTMRLEALGEE